MTQFVLLAGVMLVAALACLLLPLLRRRAPLDAADPTPLPASRSTFMIALAVALVLPASAILLYRAVGQPAALDAGKMAAMHAGDGIEMDAAIATLAARLKSTPDDVQGWALLGRAYQSMGQFAESRDALGKAHTLAPNDADLSVEYAQAMALSEPARRIQGEARQLLDQVLVLHPEHQRALWLLGISEYQAERYDQAIAAWNRLLPMLPAGSEIAQSVGAQIADAENLRAGGSSIPVATAAAPSSDTKAEVKTADAAISADAPRFTVQVSLDPALADKLKPDATLFVFARAAQGPPMPLAIQRLKASQLPLQVALDDSMGMLPNLNLSMFGDIVIGARISASGDAIAQSGDLQATSAPLSITHKDPVKLVINSIVP